MSRMRTEFYPIADFAARHEATADRWAQVALVRPDGCARLTLFLHTRADMAAADELYTDRLVKTSLWMQGGYRLLTDDETTLRRLQAAYAPTGARAFDQAFMSDIFGRPFSVEYAQQLPPAYDTPRRIGGARDGCRIGIDLGGSDRKAAAVRDGTVLYTEEVVWAPKKHSDPSYHYREITAALRAAAAHLPRVDAVGFSTAGVVLEDRVRRSSLFLHLSEADRKAQGYEMLLHAVRDTFGEIPCAVCNDGDVTALAGAMSMERSNLLGIAMGTSEAGGFVQADGSITGWLNELAFLPVDIHPQAPIDPWSGDRGVGERYFSQEGVLRLAQENGLMPEGDTPAERLRCVQTLAQKGDWRAEAVFAELGRLLGLTLPWYRRLTGCEAVLLLGRVISGRGGDLLVDACRNTLCGLENRLEILLPDESFRRLGQAAAAAMLPTISKK